MRGFRSYFALPVLHDAGSSASKLDATADRKAGTLVGNTIQEDVRLTKAMTAAVRAKFDNLAAWLGRLCDHALVSSHLTLHLTVGLPGVGKTTLARQLADEYRALRLTPDEWMAPLFGESDADGKRDILEGRFIWVAHQVLCGGGSVVLDFGCWSPEERYAIRSIAELAGARFQLHHLALSERERRDRSERRWRETPSVTFQMTDEDQDRFLALFRAPTADELAGKTLPDTPSGFESWPEWASHRWPTLPRLDKPSQSSC